MFTNQYRAYETLSVPIRDLVDGLTAVHTARVFGMPEHTAEHPVVRVHPRTGRKSLFLSSHTTKIVGMTDEDMAFAVQRLVEIGGGIVAVESGQVLAECPLPIAGLLSDAPLAEVVAQSRACNEAAHELGWTGATPFLTLSFLGLSVIPSLKITDRGLVDVDRFEIVPLEA